MTTLTPENTPTPIPRKKRRWLRWAILISLLLLLLPVAAFFAVISYIKLGYLNEPIAQKIGAMFDAHATVENVSTSWLQGLKIDSIRVESTDPTRPLTVDSVVLDWSLTEFYNERHLRSVQINRPRLNLFRNEAGVWNLTLKPTDSSESPIKIDAITLHEGDFFVEWAKGRSAHFQALTGTLQASATDSKSKSFSIQGDLTSLEHFQWDGTLGPGKTWTANGKGSLFLEKDLAWLTGASSSPKGHFRYEAHASHADELHAPIAWNGNVVIDKLHWPLYPMTEDPSRSLDLTIPSGSLHFQTKLSISEPPPPTSIPGPALDVEVWALDACRLDVPNLGWYSFNAVINHKETEQHLILSEGTAALNLEALGKLFSRSPTGDLISFSGNATMKDVQILVPLTTQAPPLRASGILETTALSCRLKEWGALPALDLFCEFNWPAIKEARLKLGNLATAKIAIDTLRFPDTDIWQALSKNVHVKELNLDLGKLYESDVGRCLFSGITDLTAAPPLSKFSFVCKGLFDAQDFKVLSENQADRSSLLFSTVNFKNVAITRWPLKFPIPAKTLMGQVESVRATLLPATPTAPAAFKHWEFIGKISTTTAAKNEPPTHCTVTLEKNNSGGWDFGKIFVNHIRSPLEELDSIFKISQRSGVQSTGTLILKDTTCFPETAKTDGTLTLENIKTIFPVPASVSSLLVQILKYMKQETLALALQFVPITEVVLDDINARLKVAFADGRLQVIGNTDPMFLKLPLVGEHQLATFPKMDIALDLDAFGKAPHKAHLTLTWDQPENGKATPLNPRSSRLECQAIENSATEGVWKITGSLQLGNHGLTLNIESPLDLNEKKLGPIRFTSGDLALAKIAPILQRLGLASSKELSSLSGLLKNLIIEVDAFKWPEISSAKVPNVRITGSLERVGLENPAFELAEFTGPFICKLSYDGKSIVSNVNLQLSSYEALLNSLDGFLIPKPRSGKIGALHLINKITKLDNGGSEIRLEQCELDLEQLLQIQASGTILRTPEGQFARADFPQLRIEVPDLKLAREILGEPNLKNRSPWFGDILLNGPLSFEGKTILEADAKGGFGKHALHGKLSFNGTSVTLGHTSPLKFENLRGDFPVHLNTGLPIQGVTNVSGTLSIGTVSLGPISATPQNMTFVATPDTLRLDSTYVLSIPNGTVQISDATLRSTSAGREVTFKLGAKCDLTELLRKNNIGISGMEGCTLTGGPLDCRLYELRDALGSDWKLESKGKLTAPFFGGEIAVENFYGRGFFGPAPVFGLNRLSISAPEGIKITQLIKKNQQLFFTKEQQAASDFIPASFSLRANVAVTGIRAAGFDSKNLLAFTANVNSANFKENEFAYNGSLAMWLNYSLVRGAFPTLLFSDQSIRKLEFGVKELAFQYELKEGILEGPRPLRPDGLIVEGYGSESNPFANTFKKDIQAEHHPAANGKGAYWGTRISWQDLFSKRK